MQHVFIIGSKGIPGAYGGYETFVDKLTEYHQDQNIEELADLMEVIYACAKARGYTVAELESVRAEKAAKRGGFDRKILLKTVTED